MADEEYMFLDGKQSLELRQEKPAVQYETAARQSNEPGAEHR